jgi:type I restriction enzyme S subunit
VSAFQLVQLKEVVRAVKSWNPLRAGADETFDYIDLSAIDQDSKRIIGAREISCGEAPSRARQLVEKDDVLVATVRPNLNGVAIVPPELHEATASTGFCVIRPDQEKLAPSYLFHWVKTEKFVSAMVKQATGASYPAVSDKIVLGSSIPLPSLPEQRRIAAILDKADALRTKRQEALAQLDKLAHSIFMEMFGDPVTNSKGWSRVCLGEIIKVGPQNGLYKPSSDYGSGIPILRIDGFYDGVVTGIASLKRLRVSEKDLATYGLSEDDIVINRVNSPEYLGKSALIPRLEEPIVYESNMMRMSLETEKAAPRYVIEFLQSNFIKSQIRTASKDAVNQSSINQQDVKGFLINLPPLPLQAEFAKRLVAIDKVRLQQRLAINSFDDLFSTLQHRAFLGIL